MNCLRVLHKNLEVVEVLPSEHGRQNVWRLRSGEDVMILKRFENTRGFRQAIVALEQWGVADAPKLLSVYDGHLAILLSALKGVSGLSWLPHDDGPLFERAGRWLRALHRLEVNTADPMNLRDALKRRCQVRLSQLKSITSESEFRELKSVLDCPESSPGRRVPCHRDFMPRNWLVDGGNFSVVDFEHARMDAWFVDFGLLEESLWTSNQSSAFWRGYGLVPDDAAKSWLRWAVAMQAAGSLLWGVRQGDVIYQERGLCWLRRAKMNKWLPR